MIIYEHKYNKDGYSIREIQATETKKQYRSNADFVGYRSQIDKTDIDIPFTHNAVFMMYSLEKSKASLLKYADMKLKDYISTAKETLLKYEKWHEDFKANAQKDTPA